LNLPSFEGVHVRDLHQADIDQRSKREKQPEFSKIIEVSCVSAGIAARPESSFG
jgi:hypothetical protein